MRRDPSGAVHWEWRVFWAGTPRSLARFADFSVVEAPPEGLSREENVDTYLLIPGARVNLKLRDEGIQCKPVWVRQGRLTAYREKRRYAFPIAPDILGSVAGISCPSAVGSPRELLDLLGQAEPETKAVTIRKSRCNVAFRMPESCDDGPGVLKGEFSTLWIGESRFQTFCLESGRKGRLCEAVRDIRIGNGRVMSYCDFLALWSFIAAAGTRVGS